MKSFDKREENFNGAADCYSPSTSLILCFQIADQYMHIYLYIYIMIELNKKSGNNRVKVLNICIILLTCTWNMYFF